MGSAAVIQRDDPTVINGQLIGADTEDMAYLPGHEHEESAARAARVRLADAVRLRPVLAVVPPLGGTLDALMTEHASTPQIELVEGDPVPLLARGLPTGLEALVGLALGKVIGTSDVAGAETIGPGHPGRGEQGLLARQELQLTDRRSAAARRPGHGHRPAPALVAGQVALEKMGDQTLGLQLGSRVLPHRERFGDLAQCRSSALDGSRRGEDSVLGGGRPLRRGRQRAGPVDGGSPRLTARSVGTRRSGRCVCCCVSHSPSLSPRALWRRGCQQGDVKGRPVIF